VATSTPAIAREFQILAEILRDGLPLGRRFGALLGGGNQADMGVDQKHVLGHGSPLVDGASCASTMAVKAGSPVR
jgi:hypothetical protein